MYRRSPGLGSHKTHTPRIVFTTPSHITQWIPTRLATGRTTSYVLHAALSPCQHHNSPHHTANFARQSAATTALSLQRAPHFPPVCSSNNTVDRDQDQDLAETDSKRLRRSRSKVKTKGEVRRERERDRERERERERRAVADAVWTLPWTCIQERYSHGL